MNSVCDTLSALHDGDNRRRKDDEIPFFDLNHIVIRQYRHLGEDIGVSEAKRFTSELTGAIRRSWRQSRAAVG